MDAIEPVEIEAGPIRLRPWREDDADAVYAAQQDPDIRMWAGGRGIDSLEDAVALLRRLTGSEGRASWAVVDATTGTLLGPVSAPSPSSGSSCATPSRTRRRAGSRRRRAFTYEGHLRRSYRYGDGVKRDELIWSRLSDDPAPELSSRS